MKAKKVLIAILFLLVEPDLQAQELTELIHTHGNYYHECLNILELRDGNLVLNCPIFDPQNLSDVGQMLYKVTRDGDVIDSLFVENHDMMMSMFERNPLNEDGYIMAHIYRNFEDTTSYLRIGFFDDNLSFYDEKEVLIKAAIARLDSYYLDEYDDIIVNYSVGDDRCMARIGLNGEMKDNVRLAPTSGNFFQYEHLGLFRQNPIEYCVWSSKGDNILDKGNTWLSVIDSSFSLVEDVPLPTKYFGAEHFEYLDEESYLMTSYYMPNLIVCAHVSKFSKSHECLKTVVFPIEDENNSAYPIGVKKSKVGGVFCSYATTQAMRKIAVAKYDEDLNLEWERYWERPECMHLGFCMRALDDGGIAVGGYDSYSGPNFFRIFLLILTDEGATTPEMEAFVKPYCVYPNPSNDLINLDISPDTRIVRAELYGMNSSLLLTREGDCSKIDISQMASGTYLLKLYDAKGRVYDEKVVKE